METRVKSGVHIIKSPVVIDGILRECGDYLFYRPPKKGALRTVFGYSKKKEKPQASLVLPIREKIFLTTSKTPEVMVKISGGGKNLNRIKDHLDYISRNGKVALEDENGDIYQGHQALKELTKSWKMGKFGIPEEGERRKEAFNIVLSMPPGTPRDAVTRAARNFARERFFNHQYVFATHDDEAHPHVHLCVKALDLTQVRLNPRKADLQQWREHFAEKLREQGVIANATPRRARGVVKRPEKQTIQHIEKRGDISFTKTQRKADMVREILTGEPYQNPKSRNIIYARRETVKAYGAMANALAASVDQKDQELALSIVDFLGKLPPKKTLHQQVVDRYYTQHPKSEGSTDANVGEAFQGDLKTLMERQVHLSPTLSPLINIHRELPKKPPTQKRVDLERLKADLNARAVDVAEKYLGQPKSRKARTWRYGTKQGSLAVTVQGSKKGSWYDFQTGEGGDMLSLIGHASGISDFKLLLQEAERFLGGISYLSSDEILKPKTKLSTDPDLDTLKRIQKAKFIMEETIPAIGTLAEQYLKEYRGIHHHLDEDTFRYHPNLKNWMTGERSPALVIPSKNEQGETQGIQAIFLDEATGRKISGGRNAKLSRGSIGTGALISKGNPGGKIAFAEGLETALSVAMAKPDWEVYVTFGVSNFEKTALKSGANEIIICADNDGKESSTAKAVERAAYNLTDKGIKVWVAEPKKPDSLDKLDFNDALILHGMDQVKKDLDNASSYEKKNLQQENKVQTDESWLPEAVVKNIHQMPLNRLLSSYVEMELHHQCHLEKPLEEQAHKSLIRAFSKEAIARQDVQYEASKIHGYVSNLPDSRAAFQEIHKRSQQNTLTQEDQMLLVLRLLKRANEKTEPRLERNVADGQQMPPQKVESHQQTEEQTR